MSAPGATPIYSVFADVNFRATGKLAPTADIGRVADWQFGGRQPTGIFRLRVVKADKKLRADFYRRDAA